MRNPVFNVSYYADGVLHNVMCSANDDFSIEYEINDNAIRSAIIPKKTITLNRVDIVFEHDFIEGDKFFGNGYQAWTTTREYEKKDKIQGLIPLAVTESLRNLAGISADNRFVAEREKAGEFYSHCYTYIRNGNELLFLGSLSERQGFTVFYADMNRNTLSVSKDVEGVTVSDKYELNDIVIIRGGYDEVFDRYFELMKLPKPRIDHMSGYTSWYNYFQKIDEKIILRDLRALDVVSDSVSIFQIDDGYETFVGDWLDSNPEKFPGGMKKIAEEIHKKGYMAGIWLAPFNVQKTSRTYKEHPDWVIRDRKGAPLLGCFGWGGAYTIDMYNEEGREYIRHFFDVILNDWNYDMVKLDFLYSQCMFPRNNKSRGTIMCEAMDFLRECCGDKLILGCGVPLGAAFGTVDACRISCDVDLKYSGKFYNKLHVNNEIPSAQNAMTNSIFRRHLNGRAFCNDPDVFFLRYSNLDFTIQQKLTLAGINHICGDVLFVSDNAEEYKHNDVTVVKKVFAPSDIRVLSADYVSDQVIEMKLLCGEKEEKLTVNIKTGESNISRIMDFPKYYEK